MHIISHSTASHYIHRIHTYTRFILSESRVPGY